MEQLFPGFSQVWSPVLLASQLRAAPRSVTVAGTPVALFRDSAWVPRALVDRCPHRGVALSLGTVRGDCLQCPFHGWEFDGGGTVRHVPWNPDARNARRGAIALPVIETGHVIWLYTAAMEETEDAVLASGPPVSEVFLRKDVRVTAIDVNFRTHWTRVIENMLDWPHLPFVHAKSIGKSMARKEDSRLDIRLEKRTWGWHSTIAIDGKEQPGALDFRWPNTMVLTIPVPGKTLVLQNTCIPIDDRTTRMFIATARDFAKLPLLDVFFNRRNRPIVQEDRNVVESSMPAEVPPAHEELSVRTDAPTLYFRKRYFAELRRSAPADGAGHPTLSILRRKHEPNEQSSSAAPA